MSFAILILIGFDQLDGKTNHSWNFPQFFGLFSISINFIGIQA